MLRTSQQQALANRACAQCNSPREEGLVACPNCKVPYRDADASALESLSIREAAIAAAVTKRAFKRVTWLFVAGFTVWSLITGGGLWQIYSDVRDYVTTLIAAKFDEASVRATLTETARTRASELMEKNLRPELDEAKAALHKELDAFRQANEFSQTVLMAQAEDRAAWDRLGIWAKDPEHPYATPAKQVWQAIIEAHNSGGLQGYVINWNNLGIKDPTRLSLEDLENLYRRADTPRRAAFLDEIAQRQDFSKRDRMRFLLEIAKTDSHLTSVKHAGYWFWDLANKNGDVLGTDEMESWWTANGPTIK